MGHHEDGLPARVHAFQGPEEALGGARVEGARRLVGEKDRGAGDERAGHGGALLLSAGELVGVLVHELLDAQGPDQGREPALHLLGRHVRQHEGQEDVVPHGEGIQQVEVLEDEPQVLATKRRQVPLTGAREVLTLQEHLPRGGLVEGGQDVEQRGLARAALPHDGNELAPPHREGHVAERGDPHADQPGLVHLLDVSDLE